MIKLTKVFSIVCFALSVFGFIGFFMMLFSQHSVISTFASEEVAAATEGIFLFPVNVFFKVLYVLVAGILLFILAGKMKIGFWAEIIIASVVSVVFPVFDTLISMVQRVLMGGMGTQVLAAYSALVSGLFNISIILSINVSLIVMTCGLSIATKFYERKVERLMADRINV